MTGSMSIQAEKIQQSKYIRIILFQCIDCNMLERAAAEKPSRDITKHTVQFSAYLLRSRPHCVQGD